MILGDVYTKNKIDKLGNAIVFLCNKMPEPLTKTHILKLIFIIEEISVKKFGMPFFDLNFYVWQLGPVAKDVYIDLSPNDSDYNESSLLGDYIAKEIKDNKVYINPINNFCDDEFSDLELELLENVVDRFMYCTSTELVNFTHRKDSPWYNTALKNGVLDLLESKQMKTTEIKIDLSETIQDDELKLSLYHSHKEFLNQSRILKL